MKFRLMPRRVRIAATLLAITVWTAACGGSDACSQATEEAATAAAITQELSDRLANDVELSYRRAVESAQESYDVTLDAIDAGPEYDERNRTKFNRREVAQDELDAALAMAELQRLEDSNRPTPALRDALQAAEYADAARVVACDR